ncbi:cxxc_20_cxxc protein [Virgibacillus subterraneus]|uniref:Cxxc_20_cxxc protein n=1 Tax=Virgibacillus subterraneus TaxID=621109 RepID=A0A1H9FGB2_9BACI|nr:TIGR04104 family putative zinc finger protein [Virgibacillus subterraneus]SEQ36368.1 cxxc_20_cxxc protein [Virgibacillus subterraneus]
MPVCQNCGEKWTWKQTIKTMFRLKCPHCGEKQYESVSSRIRGGVFVLIPLVLLPINAWLEFSLGTMVILAIIFASIVIGLYPLILKLSNKEEPYW